MSELRVQLPNAADDMRDRSGSYAPRARPNSPNPNPMLFQVYSNYARKNAHLSIYDAPHLQDEDNFKGPLQDTMGAVLARSTTTPNFELLENLHDPVNGTGFWRAIPGDAFLVELIEDHAAGLVWEYYTIYTSRMRWLRLTVCHAQGTPSPFQYQYFDTR